MTSDGCLGDVASFSSLVHACAKSNELPGDRFEMPHTPRMVNIGRNKKAYKQPQAVRSQIKGLPGSFKSTQLD